jgi:hypothetical protein
MFALADPARIRSLLAAAGLAEEVIGPLAEEILLGGGGTLDDAVEFLREGGMGRAVLAGADEAARDGRLPPSGMHWRCMSQPRECGSEQWRGSSPPAYRERLPFRSESGDFVGPQRPVGELVEGGPPGALDQAVLADPAGIHAGPAAAYVGTVAGGRLDHAVEVVVAVKHLLAGHGASAAPTG